MMELTAETTFKCSTEELTRAIRQLNVIYPQYCPDEHIVCKYLRGDPLTPGSVLYFQEYIAGKKQTIKYRVFSAEQVGNTASVVCQAQTERIRRDADVIHGLRECPVTSPWKPPD